MATGAPHRPEPGAASAAAIACLSGTPAASATSRQSSNSGWALRTTPLRMPRFTRTLPHGVSLRAGRHHLVAKRPERLVQRFVLLPMSIQQARWDAACPGT